MLVTTIFIFSHNVFYPSKDRNHLTIYKLTFETRYKWTFKILFSIRLRIKLFHGEDIEHVRLVLVHADNCSDFRQKEHLDLNQLYAFCSLCH